MSPTTRKRTHARCAPRLYRVEYGTETIDIEPDPHESVERAFERVTGISRDVIIQYEDTSLRK